MLWGAGPPSIDRLTVIEVKVKVILGNAFVSIMDTEPQRGCQSLQEFAGRRPETMHASWVLCSSGLSRYGRVRLVSEIRLHWGLFEVLNLELPEQ
jgi:hypothetical protein